MEVAVVKEGRLRVEEEKLEARCPSEDKVIYLAFLVKSDLMK